MIIERILIDGYSGCWYVIDSKTIDSITYFLVQHEDSNEENEMLLVIDSNNEVIEEDWEDL